MKNTIEKNKMINHIKYNTSVFWCDAEEFFIFEAKWGIKNSVSFKIKSITRSGGIRDTYMKKGCLSYDNSRYFISLVDSIDFKQFKKDSKNVKVFVYDDEENTLKVKTNKYSGRIFWQTNGLESKYIRTIKSLVRICKKHKESKMVLSIE